MDSAPEHIVVLVTCPAERAPDIARPLVEEKLAACVNIIPGLRSIYRWQGTISDDREALLLIKTRAALFEPLRARVLELHLYEVPEVIALPIVAGHPDYLRWLTESTRGC